MALKVGDKTVKRIYYAAAEGLQQVKEVRMGTQKIWPVVPRVVYIEVDKSGARDEALNNMLANSENGTAPTCYEVMTIGDFTFEDSHNESRTFKLDVSKKCFFTPPVEIGIKEEDEVTIMHYVKYADYKLSSSDLSDSYGNGVISYFYVCKHPIFKDDVQARLIFNTEYWEGKEGWEIKIYKSDGSLLARVTEGGATYDLKGGLYLFKGNVPYGNTFATLQQFSFQYGIASKVTKIEKI